MYVGKKHSTRPIQQLHSGQRLGSKRSECNRRNGSAIFVESERPPKWQGPGQMSGVGSLEVA
jgi:hypothetical protein